MTLQDNLAEGLTLAGTGMALVFVALVVFMVILMALQKLFPGEEMVMEMPEPEVPEEAAEPLQAVEEQIEAAPEPIEIVGSLDEGRIPGAQIAAMAVAIYLEMEREEQAQIAVAESPEPALVSATPQAPSPDPDPEPEQAPQPRSGWGALGRATFLESQGRRAPSYNHRPQSPFNPRGRDGR